MDLSFPLLEIFLPLICLSVAVLCCNTSCRAIQRAREDRRAQSAREAREADRPSVFIIPFPRSHPSDDDLYRPPRYSETRNYSPPPPPYDEVEMKPDFFMSPDAPPPPYAPPFPRPPSPSVTGS